MTNKSNHSAHDLAQSLFREQKESEQVFRDYNQEVETRLQREKDKVSAKWDNALTHGTSQRDTTPDLFEEEGAKLNKNKESLQSLLQTDLSSLEQSNNDLRDFFST